MIDEILILLQNLIGSWHIYIKDTFGWKNIFEVFDLRWQAHTDTAYMSGKKQPA